LKDQIRALTNRLSQQRPRDVLIRLNQIMHGWANYFLHAICKHTMSALENFAWHRVIRWWMHLHRWKWKDVRQRLTGPTGRWRRPTADGIELFNIASTTVTRYRYRGNQIPNPLDHAQPRLNGRNRGEPAAEKSARRVRRAAWGNGPAGNPGTAPQADSTKGP
jgi:hypothetical protein